MLRGAQLAAANDPLLHSRLLLPILLFLLLLLPLLRGAGPCAWPLLMQLPGQLPKLLQREVLQGMQKRVQVWLCTGGNRGALSHAHRSSSSHRGARGGSSVQVVNHRPPRPARTLLPACLPPLPHMGLPPVAAAPPPARLPFVR